jgi:magnesium-transporting ATPase (P-type)
MIFFPTFFVQTGTLTENRMTSSHLWVFNKTYIITPTELQINKNEERDQVFNLVHRCATLCNEAGFEETIENTRRPVVDKKV